jgi:hypothetical protein
MGAGDLADLLACVAAFARSLEGEFDPQRFLDEFSERAQALVPHDGTVIAWLEDEGRAFSAFARHVPTRGMRLERSNYTIGFDPGGRFSRDAAGFGVVFDGESQIVDDAHAANGGPHRRADHATPQGGGDSADTYSRGKSSWLSTR